LAAGLRLYPLGELKRSPIPPSRNQGGPTSKEREGREEREREEGGKGREGREGEERKGEGKEGEGKKKGGKEEGKGEREGMCLPNVESWIRQYGSAAMSLRCGGTCKLQRLFCSKFCAESSSERILKID